MLLLKNLLILLHIITAAAWFGMGLRLAAQARTVGSLEGKAAVALAGDVGRTVRFMGIFAALTFFFGLATFGVGSTMGHYGPQFHTAILLVAILLVVQYVLVQPNWKKLQNAVETGAETEPLRKRIAMGVGIQHLLWVITLIMMLWDKLRASF